MDPFTSELFKLFPQINTYFMAGILVFCRILGFFRFAPIFSRKDFPALVKLPLAIIITIYLIPAISIDKVSTNYDSLFISILLNFAVGAIVGYMAQLITLVVEAGAEMIASQMGLQPGSILDPVTSSSSQSSVLTTVMGIIGILVFINAGGVYWIFSALTKTFELFPIYSTHIPLIKLVNMDLLIKMTSNVLYVGLQIASPVLLATLAQDIILGVISRTAPQVNVFQLSFLFKPVLGCAIMIWILPMLVNVIEQYFISCAKII